MLRSYENTSFCTLAPLLAWSFIFPKIWQPCSQGLQLCQTLNWDLFICAWILSPALKAPPVCLVLLPLISSPINQPISNSMGKQLRLLNSIFRLLFLRSWPHGSDYELLYSTFAFLCGLYNLVRLVKASGISLTPNRGLLLRTSITDVTAQIISLLTGTSVPAKL